MPNNYPDITDTWPDMTDTDPDTTYSDTGMTGTYSTCRATTYPYMTDTHPDQRSTLIAPSTVPSEGASQGKAVVLFRTVEVRQWVEHTTEDENATVTRYTYTLEWRENEIDSSKYSEAATHHHKCRVKELHSKTFSNAEVMLGQFVLNVNVLERLPLDVRSEHWRSTQRLL
eukprot:535776-Rhodomonas_salina.1